MKWIKISSIISATLLIVYYISHWFLVPKLLPQPPSIAREVGRFMWWTSLTKEMQQIIKLTTYFLQSLVATALFFYVLNLFLRVKYRKWDKWFILLSLLLLPTMPFLILKAKQSRPVLLDKQPQQLPPSASPSSTKTPIEKSTTDVGENTNLPSIPGANLLISVTDEQGRNVNEGTIEVAVEFEGEQSYYNFNYSDNLTSVVDGLLGLHPPGNYPATITIQVVTPDGRKSDTLLIKNDEFWEAVEKTDKDYVGSHEFILGKSKNITYLVYE